MPTLTFNIGEAFPADDDVARFVATLAMISNDVNRSLDELAGLDEGEPDTGARRLMLFRQQAAMYYEASDFISKSVPRFPAVKQFIADLPQEAKDECAQIIDGRDPTSDRYLGDWLHDHRNGTFHYRVMDPNKAASDDEVVRGLAEAADMEGTVLIPDGLGGVRFWFADQVVVASWFPDEDDMKANVVPLREALLALVRFTQRAFAAYTATRPDGTFTERR